jgi:hypothetical protein
MKKPLELVLGSAGTLIVLLLFFPLGCDGTDVGIPPEGPDPNAVSCFSMVTREHTNGGLPGTDASTTAGDLFFQQMAIRALVLAAIPLLVGIGVDYFRSRRFLTG